MHKLVDNCVNGLEQVLLKSSNDNKEVELKKLMGDYTMDVIASCAFATKIDTHNDPNNPFVKYTNRIFQPTIFGFLKVVLLLISSWLFKMLNISIFDYEAIQFFKSAVSFIIYY